MHTVLELLPLARFLPNSVNRALAGITSTVSRRVREFIELITTLDGASRSLVQERKALVRGDSDYVEREKDILTVLGTFHIFRLFLHISNYLQSARTRKRQREKK